MSGLFKINAFSDYKTCGVFFSKCTGDCLLSFPLLQEPSEGPDRLSTAFLEVSSHGEKAALDAPCLEVLVLSLAKD